MTINQNYRTVFVQLIEDYRDPSGCNIFGGTQLLFKLKKENETSNCNCGGGTQAEYFCEELRDPSNGCTLTPNWFPESMVYETTTENPNPEYSLLDVRRKADYDSLSPSNKIENPFYREGDKKIHLP